MLTLHHTLRATLAGSCSWTLASAPAPRRTIRSDSSQDHWEMLCLDICPVLRPKQSTECWGLYLSHLLERGQLQVWAWASALIQLCWFRSQRGAVKGNISLSFPHTWDTSHLNKCITLGPNSILAAGETWGSFTQDPSVFLARDSHQNQLLSGFSLHRNAGRNLSVKFIDLTNIFRSC